MLRRTPLLLSAALLSALLGACGADGADADRAGVRSDPPSGSASPADSAGVPEDLAVAVSETREDSVYPEVGDPLVDALHYDLALAWTPEADRLEAEERLTFRATADAEEVRLDLADALEVERITVDGAEVDHDHAGKDLVVHHPVRADRRYRLELTYGGTPEPYPAPTMRSDFEEGVGWNVTADHEVWTLQEPYGAFTWYAVNDQPADKALYDFTLTVPAPWTGIANGELTDTTEAGGLRTTTWHLAEPASSYLVTVAFGDYTPTRSRSASGVPVTIWGPTDEPHALGETGYAAEAIDWLEEYLGPYPFDTFRDPRLRRRERHGDPDHGHPRRHRVHDVAAGRGARARAPLVRRHRQPGGLERRLDERGHDDVPPGHVGGRGRGHHGRGEDGPVGRHGEQRARLRRTAGPLRRGQVRRRQHLLRPGADVARAAGSASATRSSSPCCAPGRPSRRTAPPTAASTSPGWRSSPARSSARSSTPGCSERETPARD
ncbi:hypothetical protein [Nocardioides sp. TF02-7]|uniref:hypothetical protein n=1 Tax=Nocardioides sp. TF02-7 TaxID=2917724 RepID=UPI001F05DAED|nr:hypothetical protein [Nocardioides sp. TF02-7]UMG94540.1 hypothetical protein MF408_11610 [Nocardioides sp. TF02-7]